MEDKDRYKRYVSSFGHLFDQANTIIDTIKLTDPDSQFALYIDMHGGKFKIPDNLMDMYEEIIRYNYFMMEFQRAHPGPKVVIKDSPIVYEFKKRIGACSSIDTVIQFRNCVTDMYVLGMLKLEEYIELNDVIDLKVQQSIYHNYPPMRKEVAAYG